MKKKPQVATSEFFEKILQRFNEAVHYEKLRRYISDADDVIKSYMAKYCTGDNLLKFFKKRPIYSIVDDNCVELKEKCRKTVKITKEITWSESDEKNSKASKNAKRKKRYMQLRGITPSQPQICQREDELEQETLEYFKDYFRENECHYSNLCYSKFPRNVQSYLKMKYTTGKVHRFLLDHSTDFVFDDNDNVSIRKVVNNEDNDIQDENEEDESIFEKFLVIERSDSKMKNKKLHIKDVKKEIISDHASGATIKTGNLSVATIKSDDVSVATIKSDDVSVATIKSGNVSDATIKTGNVSDATIKTGNVSDATIKIGNVSDATIKTGNVSDAIIKTSNVSDAIIKTGNVSDATIKTGNVSDTTRKIYNVFDATMKTGNVTNTTIKTDNATDKNKDGEKVASSICTVVKSSNPSQKNDSKFDYMSAVKDTDDAGIHSLLCFFNDSTLNLSPVNDADDAGIRPLIKNDLLLVRNQKHGKSSNISYEEKNLLSDEKTARLNKMDENQYIILMTEFFVKILKEHKAPMYYERLRGHVSSAPEEIRYYVKKYYRSEKLLRFFKRRSVFNVSDKGVVELMQNKEVIQGTVDLDNDDKSHVSNNNSINNQSQHSFAPNMKSSFDKSTFRSKDQNSHCSDIVDDKVKVSLNDTENFSTCEVKSNMSSTSKVYEETFPEIPPVNKNLRDDKKGNIASDDFLLKPRKEYTYKWDGLRKNKTSPESILPIHSSDSTIFDNLAHDDIKTTCLSDDVYFKRSDFLPNDSDTINNWKRSIKEINIEPFHESCSSFSMNSDTLTDSSVLDTGPMDVNGDKIENNESYCCNQLENLTADLLAVEHFIGVLKNCKNASKLIERIRGNLSQAPKNASNYINLKFKGPHFKMFFVNHPKIFFVNKKEVKLSENYLKEFHRLENTFLEQQNNHNLICNKPSLTLEDNICDNKPKSDERIPSDASKDNDFGDKNVELRTIEKLNEVCGFKGDISKECKTEKIMTTVDAVNISDNNVLTTSASEFPIKLDNEVVNTFHSEVLNASSDSIAGVSDDAHVDYSNEYELNHSLIENNLEIGRHSPDLEEVIKRVANNLSTVDVLNISDNSVLTTSANEFPIKLDNEIVNTFHSEVLHASSDSIAGVSNDAHVDYSNEYELNHSLIENNLEIGRHLPDLEAVVQRVANNFSDEKLQKEQDLLKDFHSDVIAEGKSKPFLEFLCQPKNIDEKNSSICNSQLGKETEAIGEDIAINVDESILHHKNVCFESEDENNDTCCSIDKMCYIKDVTSSTIYDRDCDCKKQEKLFEDFPNCFARFVSQYSVDKLQEKNHPSLQNVNDSIMPSCSNLQNIQSEEENHIASENLLQVVDLSSTVCDSCNSPVNNKGMSLNPSSDLKICNGKLLNETGKTVEQEYEAKVPFNPINQQSTADNTKLIMPKKDLTILTKEYENKNDETVINTNLGDLEAHAKNMSSSNHNSPHLFNSNNEAQRIETSVNVDLEVPKELIALSKTTNETTGNKQNETKMNITVTVGNANMEYNESIHQHSSGKKKDSKKSSDIKEMTAPSNKNQNANKQYLNQELFAPSTDLRDLKLVCDEEINLRVNRSSQTEESTFSDIFSSTTISTANIGMMDYCGHIILITKDVVIAKNLENGLPIYCIRDTFRCGKHKTGLDRCFTDLKIGDIICCSVLLPLSSVDIMTSVKFESVSSNEDDTSSKGTDIRKFKSKAVQTNKEHVDIVTPTTAQFCDKYSQTFSTGDIVHKKCLMLNQE